MKKISNQQVSLLKINEGTLQGGFKSLDDLQKRKIKAGGTNPVCWGNNPICGNWICF